MNDVRDINWIDIEEGVQSLLQQDVPISITPMESGLEAEVCKIHVADTPYVLKIWNRTSKPDVATQYQLLKNMHHRGIAVSRPIGWGTDIGRNPVLLTSDDGTPIQKINKEKLSDIASIIVELHRLPLDAAGILPLPEYDFKEYFFPRVKEQADLSELLQQLIETAEVERTCLIHGDYHLGNILESDNRHTIIDWTNIQLGDPRYDMAWSIMLMWIYVSERHSSTYRTLFLKMSGCTEEEMEKFEAIACLRWILLSRTQNIPRRPNTTSTLRTITRKNKYLHENLI